MSIASVMTDAAARAWYRRPWLGVLSRSLAAILGGYALASASAVVLALLPLAPSEAVLTGMMVGVLVCACAALWAFAAATAWRAWVGLALPTLLLLAIAWLQQGTA